MNKPSCYELYFSLPNPRLKQQAKEGWDEETNSSKVGQKETRIEQRESRTSGRWRIEEAGRWAGTLLTGRLLEQYAERASKKNQDEYHMVKAQSQFGEVMFTSDHTDELIRSDQD